MKIQTKILIGVAVIGFALWSLPAQVITPKSKYGLLTERDKMFFKVGGALTAIEIQKRSQIPIEPDIAEVAWSNFMATATVTNSLIK